MMVHRVLVRLAPSIAGPLSACVAIGLIAAASQITQTLLLAAALRSVSQGDTESSSRWLAAYAAAFAARAALSWTRERIVVAAGTRVTGQLRDRLVGRLLDQGPLRLTGERTGRVQTTLVDGVEALDSYFSRYLPQVILAVVVPAGVVTAIATIDLTVAIVLGSAVITVLTVPRLWDAMLMRRGKQHWTAYQDLAADYLDALQGMASLRVAGATQRTRNGLESRANDLYRRTMTQLRLSLVETGISAFLVTSGSVAAVAIAASRSDQLGDGRLIIILLLAGEAFRPIRELAQYWHAGYLGLSAVDGLAELLDTPSTVQDRGTLTDPPNTAPLIEFDDVTVTYPDRDRPAVEDISFTVPANGTVAIVGPSGAGKTTLTATLLRWLDPDTGAVRIDGIDVRNYSLDCLHRSIAVVFQDTYLFAGTVADNLRLAKPFASDAELISAATAAGIHDEVAALPDGYDTVIGERGSTLSGGQRQRLAIARALLHEAPILILDEATSSVDTATEAAISTALRQLQTGRTTLIIAHRLATARSADSIVVVDDGRIVQHGTHDELLRAGGRYGALIEAQNLDASPPSAGPSHSNRPHSNRPRTDPPQTEAPPIKMVP